jgi:hypothetical protein
VAVPVRGEHPCDLGEGQIEGEYCLVDGQWWFNAGAGNWIESDGPPTTTTAPGVDAADGSDADSVVTEEDALVVSSEELTEDTDEASAPREDIIEDTAGQPAENQPEQTRDDSAPVEATEDNTATPVTSLPPTTTTEPEQSQVTEPATDENQPEQPEATEQPETTVDPEPTLENDASSDDDIVCTLTESGNVSCPEAIPEDYTCDGIPDGGVVCYPPESEPADEQGPDAPIQGSDPAWTPPVAGTVPEVHPDTPLPEWQRGDGTVDPRRRAYDAPRATERVVRWSNWCSWQNAVSCEWLLHEMYQAIDYLGASLQCVLNVYTERVNYHVDRGSGADFSYGKQNFGWHLCATVIDPIVFEVPSGKRSNDVGLRLSDTPGITLAERCRTVLTGPFPGIQLENRISQAERDRGIRPTEFGQDCDAWATWVTEEGPVRSAPACNASSRLAEEWMEHHHNQNERYFAPHC